MVASRSRGQEDTWAGHASAVSSGKLDRAPFPGENQVQIGTSIGIALASGDTIEAEQLIRQADVALYRAKAEGAGRYRFFEPEMDQRPVETMVSAARKAMH